MSHVEEYVVAPPSVKVSKKQKVPFVQFVQLDNVMIRDVFEIKLSHGSDAQIVSIVCMQLLRGGSG